MTLVIEKVSCDQLNLGANFDVGIKLKNTGKQQITAGILVVKCKVFYSDSVIQRNYRCNTDLDPGESTWVGFRLSSEENRFNIVEYRPDKGKPIVFRQNYKGGLFKAKRIP